MSGARVVSNRIAELRRQMNQTTDDVVNDVAQTIATEIKSEHPYKHIAKTVRVRMSGRGRVVLVGSTQRGHDAGFIEFGTVDQPATPVVVPIAERHRSNFMRRMKRIL